MAPGRLAQIESAGNPKSRQVMLADADHYFVDQGVALVAQVAAWLQSLE